MSKSKGKKQDNAIAYYLYTNDNYSDLIYFDFS